MSNSLRSHGLQTTRILCAWDSPARILEWVAISSPGDLPNPGIEPSILHCRQILIIWATMGAILKKDSLKSCVCKDTHYTTRWGMCVPCGRHNKGCKKCSDKYLCKECEDGYKLVEEEKGNKVKCVAQWEVDLEWWSWHCDECNVSFHSFHF